MRYLRLALLPLLLVACDQQPAAPDIDAAPALRATSEWIEFEYVYPVDGWNWGPASCLPGTPDMIAFGSVGIRIHTVTRPDGRFKDNWANPYISDDFRLEIAGDTWWAIESRMERHGVEFYDGSYDRPRKVIGHHFMVFQSEATGALLYDRGQWMTMWDEDGNVTFDRYTPVCVVK
jgi:hypothetical protein